MPTEITVRGADEVFEPPERGTVAATLAWDGPAMEPVYRQVAQDLETVRASVTALHDPDHGPVTWWSAKQLRTWSHRPWNKDGKQLPPVHHASVELQVKFDDFDVLSRWVGGHVTDTSSFRLARVVWALTTQRREELLREVRTRAVQDAVQRAQQYADALGLGAVRPVAIADAGMLGAGVAPADGAPVGYLRAAAGSPPGRAPEVELVPEDIKVSAEVDARFQVDTG